MADTPRHLLEGKIRKLQKLYELMEDPEVEAEVSQLFARRNGDVAPVTKPAPIAELPRRKSTRKGKKQNMARSAFDLINKSDAQLTARDVADQLEKQGFKFAAGDKYVAVSKALRWLWKNGEIVGRKSGSTPKAPILYSRFLQDAVPGAPEKDAPPGSNDKPVSPSGQKLVLFLQLRGPSRWNEMVKSVGIGQATLYTTLKRYPNLFKQQPDGRWGVAQKHESQPG